MRRRLAALYALNKVLRILLRQKLTEEILLTFERLNALIKFLHRNPNIRDNATQRAGWDVVTCVPGDGSCPAIWMLVSAV